jgi:hypothetical protein
MSANFLGNMLASLRKGQNWGAYSNPENPVQAEGSRSAFVRSLFQVDDSPRRPQQSQSPDQGNDSADRGNDS